MLLPEVKWCHAPRHRQTSPFTPTLVRHPSRCDGAFPSSRLILPLPPPLRYIPHLDVPERGRLPASRSRTRHLQGRQTLALQPHEAPSCEQTGEFKKLRDDHSDTICKPSRQKDFDDKRKVPKPQAAVKRLIRFHYGNLGRSLTSQRRGVNEATQFARQGARHRHPPARHMPKP